MEAIGFVVIGAGKPIVICAVDWTGCSTKRTLHGALLWLKPPERRPIVWLVQVVHQHNAPFACLEAAKIVADQKTLPSMLNVDFFNRCLDAGRLAVGGAMQRGEKVTHIGRGQAKVIDVAAKSAHLGRQWQSASSTRQFLCRPSPACSPRRFDRSYLKTVAFYAGERKLAACHYYACHPMSYYGDGRASSDFCGLLANVAKAMNRDARTSTLTVAVAISVPANTTMDRQPCVRTGGRIYDGIVGADKELKREPIEKVSWKTCDILPPVDPRWDQDKIMAQIEDKSQSLVNRSRPAYTVSWIRRHSQKYPNRAVVFRYQ